MDNSNDHLEDRETSIDVLKTLDTHGRTILRTTAVVTGIALLAAAAYFFWLQPSMRTVVLEFRPTFAGAADGLYPNGLPFGPADITASSVMDQVIDANGIEKYCPRESFKSAFFVAQQSTAYAFLDAEYEARLADTRLTAVDRDRIQGEYVARRSALPLQYQLVFVASGACQAIPPALVTKSLTDVLAVWADQSENRRGVLNLHVQILTPNVLDVGLLDSNTGLVRTDLIRTALRRLAGNVLAVEGMPGASLVRLGENKVTFAEVRGKLEDLIRSRLEPLVVLAGRGLGSDSLFWVEETLASAIQEREVAEGRADAFLRGLREYSGAQQPPAPTTDPLQGPRPSDLQTLTPQIDRTFIDRILEMSEPNTQFRQELTREMVNAGVAAVESRAKVGYYEHLAAALRRPLGGGLTTQEVETRLQEIVQTGKELAQQFNDLYEEWSAMSLRPAAAMYQTTKPASVEVSRPFTRTTFLFTVVSVLIVTLVLLVVFFVGRDHVERLRLRRV